MSVAPKSYWLLKTEPSTYSFSTLKRDGRTNWNGIRNFQARNNLRNMSVGDVAIIYHSGDDKAAVGLARVTTSAYPDPDPKKPGDWVQVDLSYVETFACPLSLKEMKATAALKTLPLITQSRLSAMPISSAHFELLCKMAGQAQPKTQAKK